MKVMITDSVQNQIYKTGTEQIRTSTKIRVRIRCINRQYVIKTKLKTSSMTKRKLLSNKLFKSYFMSFKIKLDILFCSLIELYGLFM